MPGYLVQYNRRTRDRLVTEFDGPDGHRRALDARLAAEGERDADEWEIVALISDSLSTIERTHSRYFEGREITPV
jgi:hypothetical protein